MKKFLLPILACVAVLAACEQKQNPKPDPKKTPKFAVAEIHSFWDTNLAATVASVLDCSLPYGQINETSRSLQRAIAARYGTPVKLTLMEYYARQSPDVALCSGVSNGIPLIAVFVPSLFNYYRLKPDKDQAWKDGFNNMVAVSLVHELEHLAIGMPDIGNTDPLHTEKVVWAQTCRAVLVPLVETYRAPLLATDGRVYQAWKRALENETNVLWLTFISDRYETVFGRR